MPHFGYLSSTELLMCSTPSLLRPV